MLSCQLIYKVTVGMPVTRHPPGRRGRHIGAPTPTERSVRISRTTLFRICFTAQLMISFSYKKNGVRALVFTFVQYFDHFRYQRSHHTTHPAIIFYVRKGTFVPGVNNFKGY